MKAVGWVIVVSSLLITIPRYTMAFSSVDDSQFTAVGMGILLGVGAAYIFHAWAQTKRQAAWQLVVAFCVNLLYEPFIIAPLVMARLHGWTLAETMGTGYSVFWSIAVAAAPVVLSPGIMLAVSFRREKRPQTTRKADATPMQPEEAVTKTAQVQRLAELHPEWSRAKLAQEVGCAASTVTRAFAGHMNAHRTKED